jgi:hypothetical protein
MDQETTPLEPSANDDTASSEEQLSLPGFVDDSPLPPIKEADLPPQAPPPPFTLKITLPDSVTLTDSQTATLLSTVLKYDLVLAGLPKGIVLEINVGEVNKLVQQVAYYEGLWYQIGRCAASAMKLPIPE